MDKKVTFSEGGGATDLGNIPKKNNFFETFPKAGTVHKTSTSVSKGLLP